MPDRQPYRGRCHVCLHPHDVHLHFTSESDTRCGMCGPSACPTYVDPRTRWPRLSRAQRLTRHLALERVDRNAIALLPFVRSRFDPPPLPIPQQRLPDPSERRPTQSVGGYYREALTGRRRDRRRR